jgi:hypothetical protein
LNSTPAVSLLPETFNVPVAPVEMLVDALNNPLELQRYKILYIYGNYSRILSRPIKLADQASIWRSVTFI